jgi:hypothetical protein
MERRLLEQDRSRTGVHHAGLDDEDPGMLVAEVA